jgi:hypothetical protein
MVPDMYFTVPLFVNVYGTQGSILLSWESIPKLLKRGSLKGLQIGALYGTVQCTVYVHFVFVPKTHYEHGFLLDSYRFSVHW